MVMLSRAVRTTKEERRLTEVSPGVYVADNLPKGRVLIERAIKECFEPSPLFQKGGKLNKDAPR